MTALSPGRKKKKGVVYTSPASLASQALKIVTAPQRAVDRAVYSPVRELFQAMEPERFGGTASLAEAFGLSGNEKAGLGAIFNSAAESGDPLFGGNPIARIVTELASGVATDPISGSVKLGQGLSRVPAAFRAERAIRVAADADKLASATSTAKALRSIGFEAGVRQKKGVQAALEVQQILGDGNKASRIGGEVILKSGARLSDEAKTALGYSPRLTIGSSFSDEVIGIPGTERVGELFGRISGKLGETRATASGTRNLMNRAIDDGLRQGKKAREIGRTGPYLRGQAVAEATGETGAVSRGLAAVHGDRVAKGFRNRFFAQAIQTFDRETGDVTRRQLLKVPDGGASQLLDGSSILGQAAQVTKQELMDSMRAGTTVGDRLVGVVPEDIVQKFSKTWDDTLRTWADETSTGGNKDLFHVIANLGDSAGQSAYEVRIADDLAARAAASEGAIHIEDIKAVEAALKGEGASKRWLGGQVTAQANRLRVVEDFVSRVEDGKGFGEPTLDKMAAIMGDDAAEIIRPLTGQGTNVGEEVLARAKESAAKASTRVATAAGERRAAQEAAAVLQDAAYTSAKNLDAIPKVDDVIVDVTSKLTSQFRQPVRKAVNAFRTYDDQYAAAQKLVGNTVAVVPGDTKAMGRAQRVFRELEVQADKTRKLAIQWRDLDRRGMTELATERRGQVAGFFHSTGHGAHFDQLLLDAGDDVSKIDLKALWAPFRAEQKYLRTVGIPALGRKSAVVRPLNDLVVELDKLHPDYAKTARNVIESMNKAGLEATSDDISDALRMRYRQLNKRIAVLTPRAEAKVKLIREAMLGGKAKSKAVLQARAAIKDFNKGSGALGQKYAKEIGLLVQEQTLARRVIELKAGLAQRESQIARLGEIRDMATQAHQGALDAVFVHEQDVMQRLLDAGVPMLTLPDADATYLKTYLALERAEMKKFGDYLLDKDVVAYLSPKDNEMANFGPLTKLWRAYAVLRPGFSNRNFIGAYVNNLAFGVKLADYREAAIAIAALHGGGDISAQAKKIRLDEAIDIFMRTGRIADLTEGAGIPVAGRLGSTRFVKRVNEALPVFAEEAGTIMDQKSVMKALATGGIGPQTARSVGWGVNGVTSVEDNVRLAQFIRLMKKGQTFEQAVETVFATHFDYTDLSGFDRRVRQYVPFWTYRSRSLPMQTQLFIHNPALARSLYLTREQNSSEGRAGDNLPPWLGGLAIPGGNTVLDLNNYLPGSDVIALGDMLSRLPRDTGQLRDISSSFLGGPAAIAAETALNTQFFSGRKIRDTTAPGPQQWRELLAYTATRLGTVGDIGVNLPKALAPVAPGGAPVGDAWVSFPRFLGLTPRTADYNP